MKYKYRSPKPLGGYRGGHNDSGIKKTHKMRQDPNPPPGERVLIIGPTGKRRFVWR